jgi:rare lipoprotein A
MQDNAMAPSGPTLQGALAALAAAALLAGCGSAPKAPSGRDGPPLVAPPPAELAAIPDAEPRVEPLRVGGPNKPYEVLGRSYTPETRDVPIRETGIASWYGRKFHGRRTASGEVYNMHAMTAAHKTMPLPSYARVRNPKNGREIVVRVNDRGPFVAGRVIDLSYAAAVKLGVAGGIAPVEVERITHEAIRTGSWRRGAPADEAPAAVAAVPDPAPAPAPPLTLELPSGAGVGLVAALPAPGEPPIADGDPARALTPAARGFWVQLGAFRERQGVEDFQQRIAAELDWLAPLLAIYREAPLYRLQAGPYASREDAQGAAQRVREALQLVPLVVERR